MITKPVRLLTLYEHTRVGCIVISAICFSDKHSEHICFHLCFEDGVKYQEYILSIHVLNVSADNYIALRLYFISSFAFNKCSFVSYRSNKSLAPTIMGNPDVGYAQLSTTSTSSTKVDISIDSQ